MIDLITCGAINWDINLFMEHLPRVGEEVSVREIQRVSGGTAANVAVAAARLLGPHRVAFIGSLGSDEIAKKQRGILRDEGVDDSGILTVEGESGQAYISIGENGENVIHTFFGANLKLTGLCLNDSKRLQLIHGCKFCVIMDPPLETAMCLAELCHKLGVTVAWDPGVYVNLGFDALVPMLKNIDYFILNQIEFENFINTSDPEEIALKISEKVFGLKCIIKHGAEGCTLAEAGQSGVTHINAVPLSQLGLAVVNTVGCGDAFIGGFSSAKIEGLNDVEALRWGNVAGSFKAARKETRGGPNWTEFVKMMDQWMRF